MKKVIFFDTETTGKEADDTLCQIAYKTGDKIFCELYKPIKLIPPEASAVHHISNKMVADKLPFKESVSYKIIKELFENENSIVVAHNAKFDITMLAKEDIVPKNVICTYRVANALDTHGKYKKYSLQYLRYALDFDIEAQAHDALGDVMVLEILFKRLFDALRKDLNHDDATLEKMIEISAQPILIKEFVFGKHIGKKVSDVAQIDKGYLEWLLKSKLENGDNDEDWIYTLKYYLN